MAEKTRFIMLGGFLGAVGGEVGWTSVRSPSPGRPMPTRSGPGYTWDGGLGVRITGV